MYFASDIDDAIVRVRDWCRQMGLGGILTAGRDGVGMSTYFPVGIRNTNR
jgi:hypothetical protein